MHDLVNKWVSCKTLHPLQLDAAMGTDATSAWKKCFVEAPVSIVVGVSRDSGQKGAPSGMQMSSARIFGFNPAVFSQGLKAAQANFPKTPYCGPKFKVS